jgi:beta-glucosidase
MGIWLAPGLNIQRNPMGGRNFEYYSEDPLTTGLMAASCVMGVQSQKIAATVKHYCCNNRENGRRSCDSRVSQRALREIYLRGFEICIKKAKPWALMTAYNPVNGVHSSANWEAINGILRGEWGFDGVVMTDWWTTQKLEDEVHACSDVKMPESGPGSYTADPKDTDPVMLMDNGRLDRGAVIASVRRILQLMSKLD